MSFPKLTFAMPTGFEAYRTIAAKTIAQYGGRYLVRGGAAKLTEGGPPPKTLIVVEFPSMERLREWYASPEYAEALKLRQTALDRRLIFVEGVRRRHRILEIWTEP